MHQLILSRSGLGLLSVHWYYQDLFRIVVRPFIIFFPDIFATITLIHKQIIAMAGYYACGDFIFPGKDMKNILKMLSTILKWNVMDAKNIYVESMFFFCCFFFIFADVICEDRKGSWSDRDDKKEENWEKESMGCKHNSVCIASDEMFFFSWT